MKRVSLILILVITLVVTVLSIILVGCGSTENTATPTPNLCRDKYLIMVPTLDKQSFYYFEVSQPVFSAITNNMKTYNQTFDQETKTSYLTLYDTNLSLCPTVGGYVPLDWPKLVYGNVTE